MKGFPVLDHEIPPGVDEARGLRKCPSFCEQEPTVLHHPSELAGRGDNR
jgi:hypothetical protein